jgi:hypothetical protein
LALRPALIFTLLFTTPAWGAGDDSASVVQERVTAAFLYKFASYVEWPAETFTRPDSPIVIGIAGARQLSKTLQQAVGGKQAAGRSLQVRELDADTDADDCCQILFVGGESQHERTRDLLTHAKGRPVLTVTASKDHPIDSIINFLVLENRVRFDISREAAERNGLQLRSQLLAVARQVTPR